MPPCTSWRCLLTSALTLSVFRSVQVLANGPGLEGPSSSFQVTHWTSEGGLPQNQVKALVQTRDGFIWIGTLNGLARFDGVKFTVFDHGNTSEMSNDAVNDLVEDTLDGSLWIATGNGLLRYHEQRFEHVRIPFAESGVGILAPSSKGGVWYEFGPGKLGLVRPGKSETWKLAPDEHDNTCRCLREKNSSVVIALVNHDLYEFDADTRQARDIGPPTEHLNCNFFVLERDGTLMVSGAHGIWRGHEAEWSLVVTNFDQSLSPRPQTLTRTAGGQLWVTMAGADGRRSLSRVADNRLIPFTPRDLVPEASVTRLIEDREGGLWIGSNLGLFGLRSRQLRVYSCADGLNNDETQCVTEGPEGTIWVGTSVGLSGIRAEGVTNLPPFPALPFVAPIHTFCYDSQGFVWLNWNGRTMKRNPRGIWNIADTPDELETKLISTRVFFEDRQRRIWIGTDGGAACRDNGQWTWYPTTNDPVHTSVRVIFEDHRGDIWFGLFGGGLNRLHDGRITAFKTTRGDNNNCAWWIHEDNDGVFWVGSQDGLNRFVPPGIQPNSLNSTSEAGNPCLTNRFFTFTTQQGLLENIINNIQEDDFGNLWLSGLRGIYRVSRQALNDITLDRSSKAEVLALGEADGMLNNECNGGDNQPAGCKDRHGQIWFPTAKGVVRIDPTALRRNDVPPPVVIHKIIANDRIVYGDGLSVEHKRNDSTVSSTAAAAAVPVTRSEAGTFHFAAGQARVLEIHYTANSFAAPERVRFKYYLEGYDQDWHWDDANRRVAFYTSLRPGSYTFKVSACNNHAVWNTNPQAFAFSLAPYFWQTWQFYGLSGMVVVIAATGWHLQRLHGARHLQRLEHQRAMEHERTRIARDLHDDIGASLTGVALQLEAAQRQGGAKGQQLGALATETRSLAHELRELAWTTNPRCDNTVSLASFLAEHAERFCNAAGIECKLDLPPGTNAQVVPARLRHELLVVLKESLANVAKHAEAQRVSVSLSTMDRAVCLVIQDNGHGFDPSRIAGGNGVRNLRERIQQLGGALAIESEPGSGTTVTARVPLQNGTNL